MCFISFQKTLFWNWIYACRINFLTPSFSPLFSWNEVRYLHWRWYSSCFFWIELNDSWKKVLTLTEFIKLWGKLRVMVARSSCGLLHGSLFLCICLAEILVLGFGFICNLMMKENNTIVFHLFLLMWIWYFSDGNQR